MFINKTTEDRKMPKRMDSKDILTEIMLSVFRLNAKLLDRGNELVKPICLTSARWQVLGAIANAEKAVSCPQIADSMGITRQGAQKQLNLAQKDGLIVSIPNPMNARSPLYDLTNQGRRLFEKAMEFHYRWVVNLVKGLKANDLKVALGVVRELENRLEKISVHPPKTS